MNKSNNTAEASSPLPLGQGLRVGIIGGAGYTGGEMIRLLLNHPNVTLQFVHSKSNAGKPLSSVHHDLIGETTLEFAEDISTKIDVLFLCVGHGDAKVFLAEFGDFLTGIRIIDLSQDYRLHSNNQQPLFNGQPFIYGLPELNKEQIKLAQNIANPGCFATAIQLGLLPMAKAGLLSNIYSTGITGSTGAGQGLSSTSHFSWRANNIQAYKTLQHQHVNEIGQSLLQLQPKVDADAEINLHFVPWRGDFTRGIYVSSVMDCTLSKEEVTSLYKDFYRGQPFTFVSDEMIDMKQVLNTNKCLIHVEQVGSKVVVHSTIDNLLKGASGQAVQNMNLMFGLDEGAGVRLKGTAF